MTTIKRVSRSAKPEERIALPPRLWPIRQADEIVRALLVGSEREYRLAQLLEQCCDEYEQAAEERLDAECGRVQASLTDTLNAIEGALDAALSGLARKELLPTQFRKRISDIRDAVHALHADTGETFADVVAKLGRDIPQC